MEKITLDNKDRIEYLIQNFKEVRKDINNRVSAHTQFVMQKIVTVLGGLTLLFGSKVIFLGGGQGREEDDVLRMFVLLVFPIVAGIYDIMIAKNINNIHNMGIFIKSKIEERLGEKMWEHFYGQNNNNGPDSRCYSRIDVVMLIGFDFVLLMACWGITFKTIHDNKLSCIWCAISTLIGFLYLVGLVCIAYKTYQLICPKEKR